MTRLLGLGQKYFRQDLVEEKKLLDAKFGDVHTKLKGQDGKKYQGADERKIQSEFVKTSVGDRAELNHGKGDQLFVGYRQGDMFYRKQKGNNLKVMQRGFLEQFKRQSQRDMQK